MRISYGRRPLEWLTAMAIGLAACQDPAGTPPSAGIRNSSDVARSIAVALMDSEVRHSLLQSFRASPYGSHKLFLQDFVGTADGELLAQSAASALGMSRAAWIGRVSSLPRLEISVPRRSDRMTWRATDNLALADLTDRVLPSHLFRGAGTMDTATARRANIVVIVIRRAGFDAFRTSPQPARPGDVIQDADDGDIGVQYVQQRKNGTEVVFDLRAGPNGRQTIVRRRGLQVAMDCEPDGFVTCEEDPITGMPIRPYTYITGIATRDQTGACDNWDCSQDAEFEFLAETRSPGGALLSSNRVRVTGIHWHWEGEVLLTYAVPKDGNVISVWALETDIFFDDHYDHIELRSAADYDVWTGFSPVYAVFGWTRVADVRFAQR